MSEARVNRRVVVTGLVQGVGYRDWSSRTARSLGLDGWVRNRRDGSVEALLSGEGAAVAAMVERMRRGPPSAVVAGIEVTDGEAPAAPGFSVWPTA